MKAHPDPAKRHQAVTLKIRADVALGQRGTATDSDRAALTATTKRFGLRLQPLHPDAFDPELRSYFVTWVIDGELTEALDALQKCRAVEAAYVKPTDAPP